MTSIGFVGLVGAVLCTFGIYWNSKDHLQRLAEAEEDKVFKAPGVPFVPGFAIVLNFYLTAQFGVHDHLIFGAVMGVCVGGYFSYKSFKHFKKCGAEDFSYDEYFREQEKEGEWGRCKTDGEEADKGGGGVER